ncbi:MAG: hypothetical protein Alpg2KO_13690 [Alphaproteobacteria bacterium]
MLPKHNKTRRGASLSGYGLIVGLIAVLALSTVTSVGSNVQDLFTNVGDSMGGVAGSASGSGSEGEMPEAEGIAIVDRGDGVRRWADGSAATSCSEYRSPASGYAYTGETGDGLYEIASSPYAADHVYCDMTLSDGGWQAFYRGSNGSPHVFANFELTAENCPDVENQCLRRLPSGVSLSDRFMARCGGTAITFTASTGVLNLFANGTQSNWNSITSVATVLVSAAHVYDTVWTGSATNRSFIIARSSSSSQTFMSSYNLNNGWDSCNSSANTGSPISLYFRAGDFSLPDDPNSIGIVDRGDGVREWADGTAEASCADYRDPPTGYAFTGSAASSGQYRITPSPYASDVIYCEMGIDNGGWQAIFRGTVGNSNVFAHYETHTESCSNVETQCLRRMPATASTSWDMLATCGGSGIKFNLNSAGLGLFRDGNQGGGWQPISNVVSVAGSPAASYNTLWTGSGSNQSFIIAANSGSNGTFLSSYDENTGWNICNNVSSTTAPIALYVRPPGFSP